MTTPNQPALPQGWTYTDATNQTATAPDGSSATGAVLTEVLGLESDVASLEAQLGGGTGTGTGTGGPSQSDFDALKATVGTITAALFALGAAFASGAGNVAPARMPRGQITPQGQAGPQWTNQAANTAQRVGTSTRFIPGT